MVRSRFLMQKCNIKTYGYHVYYFLFTKLKHYSVISGRVSRVGMGSGLARGAAPSTDYEGNLCLNEELGMVVRRQILRLSSHCFAFT